MTNTARHGTGEVERAAKAIYDAAPLRYTMWPNVGEPIEWHYLDNNPHYRAAKQQAFARAHAVIAALATPAAEGAAGPSLEEIRTVLEGMRVNSMAELLYIGPPPAEGQYAPYAEISFGGRQRFLDWEASRVALLSRLQPAAKASAPEEAGEPQCNGHDHDYTSTACHHGLHGRCRQSCKFCGAACACSCHGTGRLSPQPSGDEPRPAPPCDCQDEEWEMPTAFHGVFCKKCGRAKDRPDPENAEPPIPQTITTPAPEDEAARALYEREVAERASEGLGTLPWDLLGEVAKDDYRQKARPAPEAIEEVERPWRVGRHYNIHVYEGERPVATFLNAEDAQRAVDSVARAALAAARPGWLELATFAQTIIRVGCWDGTEVDGGTIQELALKLGLIERTKFDPEKHGWSEHAEPSDDWYVFSAILAAPPAGEART